LVPAHPKFSDILFTYLHLHPTVLIPETMPTPHHTRPPSPSSSRSSLSISSIPEAHDPHLSSTAEAAHTRRETVKYYLRPIIRLLLAVLAVVGALVMPSFESVMAILGGGFGVVMCIIMPVWAGGNVLGWRWWYYPVLVASGAMAVVGVVAAVLGARDA
jgi:vesicular inhibitory amino acid transporter